MLEQEAAKDPLFAESLKKENKTMEKCCDYIISQVKKSGRAGFSDSEILGMAKHYWDEDVEDAPHKDCRVVVNHTIELTEEEKRKARRCTIAWQRITMRKTASYYPQGTRPGNGWRLLNGRCRRAAWCNAGETITAGRTGMTTSCRS